MNAFENWFFTFFSGDRHAAYQLINLCSLLFIVFPISRTVCRVVNSCKYAIRMRMMLTIWCGQFLDLGHNWHLASHGERTILRLGLIILGRNLTSLVMITISQGNSEQFAEHLFFFIWQEGRRLGQKQLAKEGSLGRSRCKSLIESLPQRKSNTTILFGFLQPCDFRDTLVIIWGKFEQIRCIPQRSPD